MIYTLTLNSAIDMNIFSDPLQPNIVNRTHHTEFCPNGKGVNVALVLDHFQIPAHILGIFGGFTGHYIVESLRTRKMPVTPAWVEEPTRINISFMTVSRNINWSTLAHIFQMNVNNKLSRLFRNCPMQTIW